MATLNFDASTVDPATAFPVLPSGQYTVRITDSEMKPTRDGQGAFLLLTLEVLDGPKPGVKLFDRLNIQNANPTVVEIAYKTLSAIGHAVGVIRIQDSQQLHNIPLMAKVAVQPARGEYSESNVIKGYSAVSAGGASVPSAPAAPAWAAQPTPAAQPASGVPATPPPMAQPAAAPWAATPAATPATPAAPAGDLPPWMQPKA